MQRLLDIVLDAFPCYRDRHEFADVQGVLRWMSRTALTPAVHFLKRAQILAAEVWGCFQGQGLGRFDDIAELTMFADYRCDVGCDAIAHAHSVPQILEFLGAIQYTAPLRDAMLAGWQPQPQPQLTACRRGVVGAGPARGRDPGLLHPRRGGASMHCSDQSLMIAAHQGGRAGPDWCTGERRATQLGADRLLPLGLCHHTSRRAAGVAHPPHPVHLLLRGRKHKQGVDVRYVTECSGGRQCTARPWRVC